MREIRGLTGVSFGIWYLGEVEEKNRRGRESVGENDEGGW